ncbi:MAG: hypothetical protein D6729_07665 [Deltaproteobacteria bacterium]|nr:MAG: hypothetical protein D6729_07665 [Deltaproteobacteria bacterium]
MRGPVWLVAALLLLALGATAPAAHAFDRREGEAFAREVHAARAACRSGRPLEGAHRLEGLAAVARHPESRERLYVLAGDCLERARAYTAARQLWQRAEAALDGRGAIRAAYHAAVLDELHLGRPEAARSVYRRILLHAPDTPYAQRSLVHLLYDLAPGQARIDFLLATYRAVGASKLGPLLLYRCVHEAEPQHLDGMLERCARRLARRHRSSPLAAKALLRAARRLAERGKTAEAAALYQRLILEPWPGRPRPEALYALARLRAAEGRIQAVLALTRRLERDHPASRLADDALWLEARTLRAAGDEAGARSAYRRLLARHPTSRYAAEARSALK